MAELNDSADVFANSSTETVKENFDYNDFLEQAKRSSSLPFMDDSHLNDLRGQFFTSSPMSPPSKILSDMENISFVANQFISEACNVPVILYCPFCCFTCHFEFIFKDHIKSIHFSEILKIMRNESFYVEFHACPFCHAKFYAKELLPKHVLSKHEDSVIFRSLGENNYVQCRFCSIKLLPKHLKRLMVHVEKKHMNELDNFLKNQNTSINLSSKDMKFFCDIEEISPLGLSNKMNKLTTERSGGKILRVKSILKPTRSLSERALPLDEFNCAVTPNNGSYEAIRLQNSARRKLRFDIPESIDEDKENKNNDYNHKQKKHKVKWFSLFKKEKRAQNQLSSVFKPVTTPPKNPCEKTSSFFTKFHLDNDGVSPLTTNHFKCGLCHEDFQNNAQLLNHLHLQHRGLNLMPQYRCGACNAKFYRNSYLVRHCWFHHTPLCLKVKDQQYDLCN